MSAIECAYAVQGSGIPIVFVHGIGASRHTWDGLISVVAHRYQCISYDLRGHGRSPVPSERFGLEELVADLEGLRARLDLESMHVVGHSLGGMIAPAYARLHPKRVLSLGLLSTAAGRSAADREKVAGLVGKMERDGVEACLDILVERWFTPEFSRLNPDVVRRRREQVLATDANVFLNVFRIYAETEMGPWLREVTAPALVLTGEFDGGCSPRLNQFIAGELPSAQLVILDELRHAILLEAPDSVAAHLLHFLESKAAAAAGDGTAIAGVRKALGLKA